VDHHLLGEENLEGTRCIQRKSHTVTKPKAQTFSGAISMPRSPRATIIPSVLLKISSKFSRPSWFSILAMILMALPRGPSTFRMLSISEPA
jgi:hypothetical protein